MWATAATARTSSGSAYARSMASRARSMRRLRSSVSRLTPITLTQKLIHGWRRGVQLIQETGIRLAVRAPMAEARRMAQSVIVDLVEGDLADARGRKREPIVRHIGRPPAGRPSQPAERSAADEETVLPRMAGERHDKWTQLGEQGATVGPRD